MAKDWARMEEKARILIVDDDESTCRSMKVIFEAKNYDTDIVHTGQEAIAAIKKRSFNLAVLDIRLPDVDGITLLEQLSKMNADLGIIMITGYASMETAVDSLNKGAAAYITKPLNMDEVLITVNKALEKQRLTRAKLRAEAALQEERDRAQKYLDIAGVMFVCLDLDGAVTLVNRSGCEILGYESKEIIGKDWFKTFIPKRLRKEVYRAFSSLMKGDIEPVEYFENPILTKAGEERIIAWHNTMLTDESGKIAGTLSSGEDITERMRAEKALKESENLFRDLAESTSDWIWEVNSEGVYTLVSGKIKNILGYTGEEVLGRTPFDLMPSEESEKILPIFSDILMKKERIVDLENWNLHKDGHLVCLLTNGVPILDEEGNLLGYRGVDKDITERKKAEKALKESEAKWRSITEHSPDHIMLLNLGWTILFINRTIPDLTIEDVIGQSVLNFTPPECHEVAIECFKRVVQTGEPDSYYTKYQTNEGEIRHFEVRIGPVVQNDEVVALVSNSTDITDKKRSQDALIESEERYRSVFENLLVGFLRTRIDDSRIIFCNEVTAHIFGYDTPEEAIDDYLPVEHFVDPEFRARKMQQIRELGEKQSFLTEMTKRNGERIWVEIAATVREEEGYLDAIMVDVTERRKAEEEIKYLASLTDKVSDAIISTDSDFMIRSWNSGAEWIYGWTAEEAIGKRLKDFLQTETIGVPAGSSKKQLLEIGRWSGEALQTRKDGSTVHVYISASLLVDKKGTPTGAVVVNADITDSVRTEKALKDSEERMTALFKGIPVPTYIWKKTSDDFILSDYNNAADEISKGNMSKVLGAKLSEYYSDRLDLQEAISKVYNEKITLEQEIEYAFRYTGEHKHLNVKYSYVPPDMVLVHTEDITEKKQAEADLKFERERFISVLDALEDGIYVVNKDHDVGYTNQVIERDFGPIAERKCYDYLHDRKEPCPWCKNDEVFAGNTVRWEWHSKKNDRYYDLLDTPMENADGSISKFEILRDITERKLAAAAIKQSEERYRKLYDEVRVGLLTTSLAEGKFVQCNAHFVEMFGFESREQAIAEGISLERYANPDDRQQIISELKKSGAFSGELALTKVDGTPIWVDVSSHIDLEAGTIQSAFLDITERKRAEEALRQSEEWFRTIYEESPIAINVFDLDGNLVHANPALLNLVGVSSVEDFKNFNIFKDPNLPEGEVQRIRNNESAQYQSVIDFAKVKEAGLYDTSKSGVSHVDVRMSPLKYGEDESLHGYMIQMVDITDRVLAEKAVEKRMRELTCLLGTSQLASESELAIDAFLKSVVELLPPAWFHAEITCARILLDGLAFTTSNFKETKWKGVTDIIVGKERRGAIEVYYLEQKPDFDEGPFLKEERALIDSIAELVGNAVGRWQAEENLHELTEELEQRVKKRTQELVDANQELESFAYSVSHDLRSPLRGIAGFSRAVIEDYSEVLDETGRDYLRRMHDATVRMSELIDDILSLSRVSREEMHSEEIDMTALARTIAGELRSQEPGRKAKLVISKNIEAYGDKRLLRLVLENLLGNAWKFTSKQQSTRIEFGATEQENETVFFVRDNGAGFDMKYVDKLFNVFQRLHHADEFEGTGIGLAIVKRIISRHGGRTWAEGNLGTGATFYFMLPSKESEVLT